MTASLEEMSQNYNKSFTAMSWSNILKWAEQAVNSMEGLNILYMYI